MPLRNTSTRSKNQIMNQPDYELRLANDSVANELRQLSVSPLDYATGTIRLDTSCQPMAFLVDELSLTAGSRTGSNTTGIDFAPLASWIAVAMPGGMPPEQPNLWVERLFPLYSQTLVLLLLGFGPARSDWRGWVIHRGSATPITSLRGIGKHPFRVHDHGVEVDDTIVDLSHRWSRTERAIGESVQQQLSETTISLVGCSGVGSQLAIQLAALPIRRIGLIDGDMIEAHNLSRMPLATESDLGQNKALVLGQRLAAMRSDLAIMVSDSPLRRGFDNPATHGADMLITAVDRDTPRLLASQTARRRMIPHLDVGTAVRLNDSGSLLLSADVRFLMPTFGAGCISCVGGLRDQEEAEYELMAPAGSLRRLADENWDARGRLGSLATINATAAATAIQMWLDMLRHNTFTSKWHRIIWHPHNGWESHASDVTGAPNCKFCRKSFAA